MESDTPALSCSPANSRYFRLLRSRILHRHLDQGWDGVVRRLQDLVAEAEAYWCDHDRAAFLHDVGQAVRSGAFLPNSPLLVNAGNEPRRLFACFVVDSRRSREEFLQIVRTVHDGMGGVGYTLDKIATAAEIERFVRSVDRDTAMHQPSRPRPASCAITIPIDAGGSNALLNLSGLLTATSLNFSLSDAFMARTDEDAQKKLDALAQSIYDAGEPGVIFSDRIPQVARDLNAPFASNVCGETPLAADESGLLGSINLVQCLARDNDGQFTFDEARFAALVRTAVRFLDDMFDLHAYPHPQVEINSLATRKIGVGMMGFAHFLALLGIRYGDAASTDVAARLGNALFTAAREESERLGRTRGHYPAWSRIHGVPARRNASLAAIAGTSTLALLVETTGGIEPIFSHVTRHRVMGETSYVLDRILAFFGWSRGIPADELRRRLLDGEPLGDVVGEEVARVVPLAHEIPGEQHVEVQAAFQRGIDGGISKTLNCPSDSSVDDIKRWIRLAHSRGCMGLTIYRNSARIDQPMTVAS